MTEGVCVGVSEGVFQMVFQKMYQRVYEEDVSEGDSEVTIAIVLLPWSLKDIPSKGHSPWVCSQPISTMPVLFNMSTVSEGQVRVRIRVR